MIQFAKMMERRLSSEVAYPPVGKSLPYRQVMEQQARRLARYFMGEEAGYEAFLVR